MGAATLDRAQLEQTYLEHRDRLIRLVLWLSRRGYRPTISYQQAEDLVADVFVDIVRRGQPVALDTLVRCRYAVFCRRRAVESADLAARAAVEQQYEHMHDPDLDPPEEPKPGSPEAKCAALYAVARDQTDRNILDALSQGQTLPQVAAGVGMSRQAVRKRMRRLAKHCPS